MTAEDIEQQQKDALWAHRQAVILAENARQRVRSVAAAITGLGDTMSRDPLTLLSGHIIAGRATPPAAFPEDAKPFVSYDALLEILQDLQEASAAVTARTADAHRLGVPV